jgi:hypothetical protein
MKKQTLDILHRYRKHLLEQEQMTIVERLAEENNQKVRLLQLQQRIAQMHEAKLRATSSAELVSLDDAATYLNSRLTMAQRALALAKAAREEAVARTLQLKKERDQVGLLIDKNRQDYIREQDAAERNQLNELATARYAMAGGGL